MMLSIFITAIALRLVKNPAKLTLNRSVDRSLILEKFKERRNCFSKTKDKKIIIAGSTSTIILGGVLASVAFGADLTGATGSQEPFSSDEFWLGFTSFSYQLRFDGLLLLFILPLIVGLFIASRNGITHADSIMLLIAGILFTAPLLTGFTDQTNQPYRFVPLVVFFAVGVGVLLSKRKSN